MTIPSGAQPPAGTVGVAQLLADAQTKLLWLGVPATVSPSQSVLVGDIVGLMQADTDTLASAQAFTTSGLAGKANTTHTHAIADVTGLAAALAANAAVLPAGLICMWSGTLISIPAGWVLCDGTLGTPDLRDKFIMGAGTTAPGANSNVKNKTVTSTLAGGHSHGGVTGDVTLTLAQIPSHTHTVTDPGHIHGGTTDTEPNHQHTVVLGGTSPGSVFGANGFGARNSDAVVSSSAAGTHAHNLNITSHTTGITLVAAGSGSPHNHSIASVADHQHSVTVDVTPPFYALAFIMKQ